MLCYKCTVSGILGTITARDVGVCTRRHEIQNTDVLCGRRRYDVGENAFSVEPVEKRRRDV